MARARNIKPGFFTNDELVELPFEVRLLFIGLWTVADRDGRLLDRPKKIRMDIFPGDDVDIEKALCSLSASGFIDRYIEGGTACIQIINWDKHQNPHMKEAPSAIPERCKHQTITVQAPDDTQPIPERAGLIPDSLNLIPDTGYLIPEITPSAANQKLRPAPDVALFPDVDLQIVVDFKAMRAKQKAPITKTAMDGIRREADIAGLSLEGALMICCERSWRGFKASWVLQPNRGSPQTYESAKDRSRREASEQLTGRKQNDQRRDIIDLN